MKKKDMILGAAALLLAAGMLLVIKIQGNARGDRVIVTVDGEVYGTYDLNKSQEILINLKNGYNKIVIEDGQVHMEEADCPDGYCKRQGYISGVNDTVICLPHKLVVEIGLEEPDAGQPGVDVISK